MYTVIWFWDDGTMGQYKTNTKQEAEMMARQLAQNDKITAVNISDM